MRSFYVRSFKEGVWYSKNMSCIGTAGHIDHGKSTLVEALTGIDPDRLAEEKARGMTIDLGFAWLTLPDGREVSIIDVPGHEGFIKNMLAGVGGIDAALLVVAADEGVMPQTREHLAILDQLRVRRGVVALTKADLVDEEWLDLVRVEVAAELKNTTLADAPMLAVSAQTRQGLPALLNALMEALDVEQIRQDIARPRLPIDRVFTMTGFGTVVTGTLLDGVFRQGQEVEILPQGLKTRIRTLQTHRRQVAEALPGNRVALNLANIPRSELERGNIVALPGQLKATMLLDARIEVLSDAARPLVHNTQVDFYCGSQEVPAQVRLLDANQLEPGQQGWAQLRLEQPIVVARRDRFILRIPSPSATLGGGEVIDAYPRFHRRHQPPILTALATLAEGSPDELVLAVLHHSNNKKYLSTSSILTAGKFSNRGLSGYELTELTRQSNLSEDVTLTTLETLLEERRVRKVGLWWFAQSIWDRLCTETRHMLQEQHHRYPLRGGLSREEWRTRLGLSSRMATDVFFAMQAEGVVSEASARSSGAGGGLLRLPNFSPRLTDQQQKQVEHLLTVFRANPYGPPGRMAVEEAVGAEVLGALVEQGVLVRLGNAAEPTLFLRETYDEAVARLTAYLREHQTMTAAEARDVLGTSRKYILPLLEHLDERRITRRVGDQRFLGSVS